MILRADSGINPKAFIELYVYAFSLVNKAVEPKKTVVLDATCPNKTLRESFRIRSKHSEILSAEGWAVLDLESFQPHIERLLAQQKNRSDQDAYLYRFLLPLITSGVFTKIHFCKTGTDRTSFEHIAAERSGVSIVDLE